jgi:Asp-tRNA(Asn)/Glu-tRNA(Gln) amidotransferase C subunit
MEVNMGQLSIEEERLKELLKQALVEFFDKRRDLFYEVVSEVFEDIAMANAIREGNKTPSIRNEEIMSILEGDD